MANHVEKHLGNSDTEDSRTKKKCLCFEVCALCLSSTMESSRLYMWQNLVGGGLEGGVRGHEEGYYEGVHKCEIYI